MSKITSTAGARSLSQLAAPLSGMIGRNFLSIDELSNEEFRDYRAKLQTHSCKQ